ncbi:hypothetical protein V6Z92_004593 [Aspergillus fumigatus]
MLPTWKRKVPNAIRILKQLKRYIDGVVSSQLRPKSTERRRFLSYYSRASWRIAFCFYIISAATEDFRGYPPLSILGQALAETSIGLSDGFVSLLRSLWPSLYCSKPQQYT